MLIHLHAYHWRFLLLFFTSFLMLCEIYVIHIRMICVKSSQKNNNKNELSFCIDEEILRCWWRSIKKKDQKAHAKRQKSENRKERKMLFCWCQFMKKNILRFLLFISRSFFSNFLFCFYPSSVHTHITYVKHMLLKALHSLHK